MSDRRKKQVERIMANFSRLLKEPKQAKDLLLLGTIMKLLRVVLDQLNEIEEKMEDIF